MRAVRIDESPLWRFRRAVPSLHASQLAGHLEEASYVAVAHVGERPAEFIEGVDFGVFRHRA
jgi:hypothetical protein